MPVLRGSEGSMGSDATGERSVVSDAVVVSEQPVGDWRIGGASRTGHGEVVVVVCDMECPVGDW